MEIKHLTVNEYDELINLLNSVFERKNNRKTDFEKDLPKMCVRDNEHMGNHIGVFEDGKLVSALGIYKIPAVIAGEKLLFTTVGNVATHWDYAGRGYMNTLMNEAMRELEKIGADASRLGGLRQRYARFGYETCGTYYNFTVTSNNVLRALNDANDLTFEVIGSNDEKTLLYCRGLYEKGGIYALRDGADMYASMTAWQCTPYIARNKDGRPVGYLCATPSKTTLAEIFAESTDDYRDIVASWQKSIGANLIFRLPPYETDAVALFSKAAENLQISSPCHFKIINFEKVTDALMKLTASYRKLPDCTYSVGIEYYGTLELYSRGGAAGCRITDKTPDVLLTRAEVSRFLYGPLPPYCVKRTDTATPPFLPLPLSWNLQDRV